ncbi:MAG: uroporphyrinogen decarboxylase family protein [Defluviitaleaceae bacterium]|nr:uroporphyrinogen decarboxylase family protein [Defluviitaleaceae bacterium]
MTGKERWINCLERKETDRFVFWPKLYGMEKRERYDEIGCDFHLPLPHFVKNDYGKCSFSQKREGDEYIRKYATPRGTLVAIDGIRETSHPVKMAVQSVGDIRTLTFFYENITVDADEDKHATTIAAYEKLGNRGIAASCAGSSPFMHFLESLAGIDSGHLLAEDHPKELERLLRAMHRVNVETLALICERCPSDIIYFMENTSTTVLSPGQFEKYCVPFMKDYCDIAEGHGRRLVYHMCGHLKNMLPLIDKLNFTAVEAFTSPPVGNATFAAGKAGLPGKSFIGGTNCLTWLKPAREIILEIEESLEELRIGGFGREGLAFSTGGMSPPGTTNETFAEVFNYLCKIPVK